jgi:SsrA-binding protein
MKDAIMIQNRKASYDYFFLRSLVAGMQLVGSEVKQVKAGKITLVDSFCTFENGELFLRGVNIPITEEAFSHEPLRPRKLLLKRKELDKLEKDFEKGTTIIVKKIFSSDRGIIKAEIALAKGKKNFDKRESIKEKEIRREIQREIGK